MFEVTSQYQIIILEVVI